MQVEKLQDDIVASHGVGDAQDAQDDAVCALASGRKFFFWDVVLCISMLLGLSYNYASIPSHNSTRECCDDVEWLRRICDVHYHIWS